MIQKIRNTLPAIDFGFGRRSGEALVGEAVTVWLQTLYNEDAYTFMLQTTGTVNKISNYQYEVTFAAAGSHTIQLAVTPASKKTSPLISNILDLTVTEPNG